MIDFNCPYCGTEFTGPDETNGLQYQCDACHKSFIVAAMAATPNFNWGRVLKYAVVIGLFLVIVWPKSGPDQTSSDTPEKPDKIFAWVMAQKLVKTKLTSPSTADFGSVFGDYQSPEDVVTDLGDGKFRVKAWVDSQNTFGAMIRKHFICEVETDDGVNWRMTRFELQ